MRLWILAILLGTAIWIALFLGYLGIERTVVAWILATIALLAIPAIAIAPLLSSLRAIHKAQWLILSDFEPFLNDLLIRGKDQVRQGRRDEATQVLSTLGDVTSVHQFVVSINPWPFNPRALAVVIFIYCLQLFLTLRELL